MSGLLAVFALPTMIAASAARHELLADFRPDRSIPTLPANLEQEHVDDVLFEARGITLRGWSIPSANGAAVVFLHGTDANRSQLSHEAHLLAQHGYGALLFDWPGHGESDGGVTWDANERAALGAALDFISTAPGVDPERIGVFAFSRGTMMAVQVAAADPRVAALAVEGAFADISDALRHAFRHWGFLSQWPALWTAKWLGMKSDKLRPVDLIGDIAPRAVFVIAGTADDIVPPAQSRALFDAAQEPKSWWLVNGATHMRYAEAPDYEEKIVGFFDDQLLQQRKSSSLPR